MTTRAKRTSEQKGPIPWRKRADFKVGTTRKQRQSQYRQQVNALLIILLAAVVMGGLVVSVNYRSAGSTKTVSCEEFPEYCVPLAGGATGSGDIAANEAAGSRTLDTASNGAPGVVRGFNTDNVPFIGDPNAPIQFVTVMDFACSHCQDFHLGDLKRFFNDYVLTGEASFGVIMTTGTGGAYSEIASQAALCAGEQGAYWEMSDELFRLANSMGVQSAFSLAQIKRSADDMGLDSKKLVDCVNSSRYLSFLNNYRLWAQDNGVTGTPTVLYRYSSTGTWNKTDRSYANLQALTEAANANAQ
jgi:protein-disulfide isomerase